MGLLSCNNEIALNGDDASQVTTPKQKILVFSTNMRCFNDFEELSKEIDQIATMPFDKLVDYEKSMGFNSFGKLADLAYKQFESDTLNYKSIQDAFLRIQKNYSNYLALSKIEKEEEYTLDIKLEDSPFKYIINEDRICQISDTLIKVLDCAVVYTDVSNFKELLSVTENNLSDFIKKTGSIVIWNSNGSNNPSFITMPPLSYPQPNFGRYQTTYPDPISYSASGHKYHLTVKNCLYNVYISGNKVKDGCNVFIKHTKKGFLGIYWYNIKKINYDLSIKVWAEGNVFALTHLIGQFNAAKKDLYSNSFEYQRVLWDGIYIYACFTYIVGYVKTPDYTANFNLIL